MELDALVGRLKNMYFGSERGETAVSIHLFGIKYASEINECGLSPKSLAKLAGIPETYGTEINKGRNLAKFVTIK
jgi:hypothetical protein